MSTQENRLVNHRRCERCVMDTTDPEIEFFDDGTCNRCRSAEARLKKEVFAGPEHVGRIELLADRIRKDGAGKPYDCVIGVSGGVDSSYVAYLLKRKYNLNPLAVHFDNGWNSELAVNNIELLLQKLGIDLKTYVMDWNEFREIQLSFLRGSLANAEIPTDHAINALLFRTAMENNIKYIISGGNLSTESVMPSSWMENAMDARLLKSVNKKFGKTGIKNLPVLGAVRFLYATLVRRIKLVTLLNYIDYDKEAAIEVLEKELGWRRYAGKHFESIFTRFFQGYYLPRKFEIDKRLAHNSSLIVSGQMTREEAMEDLRDTDYDEETKADDIAYVLKKLQIDESELESWMEQPRRGVEEFDSYEVIFNRFSPLISKLKTLVTMRD